MDPNEAQATYDNPYYHDGTYPMTPLNQPPINPPLPPHSGQLGPPMMYQSANNASYVKMNSSAVKGDTMSLMSRRGQRKSLSMRGWDYLTVPCQSSEGTYMLTHEVTAEKNKNCLVYH